MKNNPIAMPTQPEQLCQCGQPTFPGLNQCAMCIQICNPISVPTQPDARERAREIVRFLQETIPMDSFWQEYFERTIAAALAEKDEKISKLESKARDMESTYQFGSEVMGRLVLPRIPTVGKCRTPMQLLEEWLVERDTMREQLAERDETITKHINSMNEISKFSTEMEANLSKQLARETDRANACAEMERQASDCVVELKKQLAKETEDRRLAWDCAAGWENNCIGLRGDIELVVRERNTMRSQLAEAQDDYGRVIGHIAKLFSALDPHAHSALELLDCAKAQLAEKSAECERLRHLKTYVRGWVEENEPAYLSLQTENAELRQRAETAEKERDEAKLETWRHTCIHHTDAERAATEKVCPVCVMRKLDVARKLVASYNRQDELIETEFEGVDEVTDVLRILKAKLAKAREALVPFTDVYALSKESFDSQDNACRIAKAALEETK